jgi:hypothetical protein
MANPNEASIFIKLKDEDVAKLLHFTKSKEKSKLFYDALLYYIVNSDEVEKFANPIFEAEFKKAVKKITKKIKI